MMLHPLYAFAVCKRMDDLCALNFGRRSLWRWWVLCPIPNLPLPTPSSVLAWWSSSSAVPKGLERRETSFPSTFPYSFTITKYGSSTGQCYSGSFSWCRKCSGDRSCNSEFVLLHSCLCASWLRCASWVLFCLLANVSANVCLGQKCFDRVMVEACWP